MRQLQLRCSTVNEALRILASDGNGNGLDCGGLGDKISTEIKGGNQSSWKLQSAISLPSPPSSELKSKCHLVGQNAALVDVQVQHSCLSFLPGRHDEGGVVDVPLEVASCLCVCKRHVLFNLLCITSQRPEAMFPDQVS